MNKSKQFFSIGVLIGLMILISCEKDETDAQKTALFGKLEIIYGDNLKGYFGEFLPDSIVLKASSNNAHRRYSIQYKMLRGNGNIEGPYIWSNSIHTDTTGIFFIRWRLGGDFDIQQVKLMLYVDSVKINGYVRYYSQPCDSITISAQGTKPSGWGRSCGLEELDYAAAKIISFDNKTLYLVSRGLYSSTDNGLNWNKVMGIPDWENIADAQFNNLGWLYLATRGKGVSYSKDMQTWQYINNGIIDPRNPTSLLVENSTLFVNFALDGFYKTSNNGDFWRKIYGVAQNVYHLTRHPNGELYYTDGGSIYKSMDSGNSWVKAAIHDKYIYGQIFDMEIDNDGFLYIGSSDANISKVSSETYQGEIHNFYQMNHTSQVVDDIKIINNITYFTVNGNPTPGIYSSQNWQRLDLGFEGPIANYYLKQDGTFQLITANGSYYYNK